MAVINFARREIEAKVVYYGPAFSGKTTNVQKLHELVPGEQRGELHQMATAEERTLFFDYVPVQLGQVAGFNAKFKLFTVPGQVFYKETRKVVLQGADAVVFVADSSPDRADSNIDALIDLEENLRSHGLDLASIPLVIQLNKRDVPGARSVLDMSTDLNPFGVPVIEAVAFEGRGVAETLKAVTDLAAQRIRDNLAGRQTAVTLTAVDRSEAESDQKVIREHLERIKRVRPYEEQRGQKLKSGGHVQASEVDAFLLANVERADEYLGGKGASPKPGPSVPTSVPPSPTASPARGSGAAEAKAVSTTPPGRSINGPAATRTVGSGNSGARAVPKASTEPPPEMVVSRPRATAASVAAQVSSARPVRELPPPPPVPKEAPKEALPPAGPIIEAAVDPAGWVGARVERVAGARYEHGAVFVDVVIERGGERRTHPVKLVGRPPPPPPPAAAPAVLGVVGAAVVAGGFGVLLGVAVGWFVAIG